MTSSALFDAVASDLSGSHALLGAHAATVQPGMSARMEQAKATRAVHKQGKGSLPAPSTGASPSAKGRAPSAKGVKAPSAKGMVPSGAFSAHVTDCGGGRVVSQWCAEEEPFCFAPNYHCCSASDAFCPGGPIRETGGGQAVQRPELAVGCLIDASNCRAGFSGACERAQSSCAPFGEALGG